MIELELGDKVKFRGEQNKHSYSFAGWVRPDDNGFDCVLRVASHQGGEVNILSKSELLERTMPVFEVGRTYALRYITGDRTDGYRFEVAAIREDGSVACFVLRRLGEADNYRWKVITTTLLTEPDKYQEIL